MVCESLEEKKTSVEKLEKYERKKKKVWSFVNNKALRWILNFDKYTMAMQEVNIRESCMRGIKLYFFFFLQFLCNLKIISK